MGLIAHYRLDGDATDAVGNNHGTASNVTWVDGKLGKAAQFQNIPNCHVAIPNDLGYTTQVSVSAWFKSLGTPGGGYHIITGGPVLEFSIPTAGSLRVGITTSTGRKVHNHGGGLTDGQWHHVAMTFDGTTKIGYIDGIEVGRAEVGGTLIPNVPDRALGAFGVGSNYLTNALIDDVRIYDHALSAREVRDLSLGLAVHHTFQHDFYDVVRGELATPVGDVQLADIDGRRCAVINSSGKRLNIEPFSAPVATLTFWHKRDDAQSSSSYRTVFGCVANIHPAVFVQGTRAFGLWDGSFKSSGYVPPNDGTFHFYTTVLQGDGTALFYVDGAYLTTVSTPLSLVNNPIDRIGSWTSYYAGLVGEVKLFATALTAAQIQELYHQRASIDSEGSVHIPLIKEGGRGGVEFTGGNNGSYEADGDFLEASSVVEVFPEVERTLEFWAYPAKRASSNIIISLHTEDAIGDRTYIDDNNAQGNFRFYVGGSSRGAISNVWEFDRWQHIALVFSSSGISAYRDGIEVGSTSATWDLGSISPSTLQIGRGYHSGGARYFVGRMSDFRIWDKSLSQGEIVDVGSHRVMGNESGLIACWPMREGGGDLVRDVVSGRDADLHGGRWIVDGPFLSNSLDLMNTSEVGVTRGLVAWYPLIGDTLDYADTNHAINNGGVATAEGYEFVGGEHLLTGFPLGESTLGQKFTWTWLDRPSRFASNIGSHGSAGTPRLYKQWVNATGAMRVAVGDSFWTAIPSNNIPLGAWSFFAVVFDEGEVRTYLNGHLQDTKSGVVFSGESSSAYSVGRGYSNARHYEGVSRDHRIYNVALTPEEVAIQAKLALNPETKIAMTQNCLYTKGQIKEVIV